jgi:hypothetical protein
MWSIQRGHKWRHSMAHKRCMLGKQDHTHAHVNAHAPGHPHTHYARTHASARTYGRICNTYCFSTETVICERATVLHYTHIACLVYPVSALLAMLSTTGHRIWTDDCRHCVCCFSVTIDINKCLNMSCNSYQVRFVVFFVGYLDLCLSMSVPRPAAARRSVFHPSAN